MIYNVITHIVGKSKVQGKPGKKNSGQNNGQNAAQNKSKVTTNVETTPTKKKTSLPSEIGEIQTKLTLIDMMAVIIILFVTYK